MTRDVVNQTDAVAPLPGEGWSRQIATLQNAIVVPPTRNALVQEAGILTEERGPVPLGATWRYERQITRSPRTVPDTLPTLEGQYLWGGVLFGHFGHFLTESTMRLWGIESAEGPLKGVVFVQKRPRASADLKSFQQKIFDLFGIAVPIRVLKSPSRVERLIVPGQGFGLGAISHGTPEMRDYVQRRFAPQIPAEGPSRLYISRSGLGEVQSMILGEDRIETYLQAEGYEIFHPQDHSLEVQIARFRAAREIIIADGSAAHLLGFVIGPHQRVAYLLRRTWYIDAPINQIAGFAGKPPVVINAIRHQWMPHNLPDARDISFAEIDFEKLQSLLLENGFVSPAATWKRLHRKDIRAAFERMGLWRKLVRDGQETETPHPV